MAVERMRLLSVVGKEENINSFILKYLMDSGLQPENAIKVFEKGWNLSYFAYDNTARELQKQCQELENKLGKEIKIAEEEKLIHTLEELEIKIKETVEDFGQIEEKLKENEDKYNELNNQIEVLSYLKQLDIELDHLYGLRYMRFRYGKISKENYEKITSEIDDVDAIVIELGQDEEFIWLMYLTTDNYSKNADSFFNIAKFERTWIPAEITGKPVEAIKELEKNKKSVETEIHKLKLQQDTLNDRILRNFPHIKRELDLYLKINTIKRYMAHDKKGNFYIVGWLPLENIEKIKPALEKEKSIDYVVKTNDEVASTPPTHLKNHKIFKPFESLVEMYGLPNYTELDPTAFVAITAFLMFGFMFGDVGHGLIFFIIGLILKKKKSSLGPVLVAGGVSSMIFGALYGSVFGSEEVIPQLLIRPMDDIQTMLIAGVAFGAILILIAMILNVVNGIRNKDKSKIFFDGNGIAGIVFYITVLASIAIFLLKGEWVLTAGIIVVLIVIPLLLIFFKEPLTMWISKRKITKKRIIAKTSFVEKFFEMFEMLLSFISNTISFVRLAAFAINHVGLCMAVFILANMVSGTGSIFVLIIGNAIVVALEGLIVAIQVLRLEYYELFSRFYTGDGREYEPINVKE